MKFFASASAVVAMLAAGPSLAAEPTTAEKDALTVEQALQVKTGLEMLGKYETTDKDGKAGVGFYRFPADTLMMIALNIDLARRLETQIANANNALVMQMSDGVGTVPEAKRPEYNVAYRKMLDAPSRVGFYHVKRADLCLEEAPPKCPVANPIPGPVLGLIISIVDR